MGSRFAAVVAEDGIQGYDHCFCRAAPAPKPEAAAAAAGGGARASAAADAAPTLIAELSDAVSGRSMSVLTTAPGVQLYCGNYLSGAAADAPHDQHRALCLETQNYPDAINQPHFPSALLLPGEEYVHKTVHQFRW